jgi:hypothetical protein
MKNLKINLGILAVLGLLVPIAPASHVVDWAGTWIGSIDTQGMGVDTITLVLKKADTTYTGIINDSLGLIEKDTVITEVKLDGEAISLSFKAVGGSMDFVMKMTAGGETITAQMMNKAIGEWGSFESLIKK